jgi:RNA polymerase sigma factor (sigma-70 family)
VKCDDKYLGKITDKYNKRHATAFARKNAEKKFLAPWGLSLRKYPPPVFGNQQSRLSNDQEFQLFASLHFMKYHLKNCSKRLRGRYFSIYIALRNRGISANWPLILSCTQMQSNLFKPEVDTHSLLESGYIALIAAVDGFDPWRGWKFSTYACKAILWAFHGKSKIARMTTQHEGLENLEIRMPCPDENTDDINRLKKILNSNCLDERETCVIAYRFGFRYNTMTLEEVGKICNLTKERIRQIQLLALEKLKKEMCNDSVIQTDNCERIASKKRSLIECV